MTTSNSLTQKMQKQRRDAPRELPKTRLCAAVVWAVIKGDSAIELALSNLKAGLGPNWTLITAFQFMSGRQARFSAECGQAGEQASMLLAHEIAEAICDQVSLGNVSFAALRAIALANLPIGAPVDAVADALRTPKGDPVNI